MLKIKDHHNTVEHHSCKGWFACMSVDAVVFETCHLDFCFEAHPSDGIKCFCKLQDLHLFSA